MTLFFFHRRNFWGFVLWIASSLNGFSQIAKIQLMESGMHEGNEYVRFLDGYKKEVNEEIFTYKGVRVNAITGVEEKKDNYSSTGFISTEDIGRLSYELPYSSNSGITFFDINKEVIAPLAQYSSDGGTYDGIIPENVKYIRLSRRTDGNRGKSVIFYGAVSVSVKRTFELQEADNSRMINPRYQVFSNKEFRYQKGGNIYYYKAKMPNHQVLNDGSIVVVTELFGDNRYLAIKRSVNGGRNWDNNIRFEGNVLKDGMIKDNDAGGNPVLLYDRIYNELYLFYQTCSYRKSIDGGKTWGNKISVAHLFREKYAGYRFYASPCNGIQLTNGIIAIAYRIEDIRKGYDRVCILFSRDRGNSWEISPPTPLQDCNGNAIYADETALVEYKQNCIMLNSRGFSEISLGSRINRRVFVQGNKGAATAKNWNVSGWTIEPISDLKLLDPVCQGSLVKAEIEGKTFGVFANIYSDSATRTNLMIRVSADFKHWSQCMFLTLPGEIVHGYSSMCCINNELSVVSDDSKGIYYMPFGYEFTDKLMRVYTENYYTYK